MILASSKGSLMELGISPIITSGMIMQLLAGAKIIEVDTNDKNDRQLFNAASKLLGIVITIGEAVAYVLSGMYGDIRTLGPVTAILLILQLFVAGIVVLSLDDMLSKGWGLGGGINLFIVTNICEGIVWKAFSPTNLNGQFEGVFPSLFAGLFSDPANIHRVILREDGPNILNLAATVLVFLVVIYIQGWKINLPLTVQNGPRGMANSYPIKLFYTSNMPIILLSALISNLYFFSQVLYRRYPSNILINLLGRWAEDRGAGAKPVGGLAYYVSPPQSFADVVSVDARYLDACVVTL
jgi:protein transport protein SEC61 subunit alpha